MQNKWKGRKKDYKNMHWPFVEKPDLLRFENRRLDSAKEIAD